LAGFPTLLRAAESAARLTNRLRWNPLSSHNSIFAECLARPVYRCLSTKKRSVIRYQNWQPVLMRTPLSSTRSDNEHYVRYHGRSPPIPFTSPHFPLEK
jgi:hypothetical protein